MKGGCYLTSYLVLSIICFGRCQNYYGYGSPYSASPYGSNAFSAGTNLFTGIAGDLVSAMASALTTGVSSGYGETFYPGSQSFRGNNYRPTYQAQNFVPPSYTSENSVYYMRNPYLNSPYGYNNLLPAGQYQNVYWPYSNAVPMYNNPNNLATIGSTYGGFSDMFGRPIRPIVTAHGHRLMTTQAPSTSIVPDQQVSTSSTTVKPTAQYQKNERFMKKFIKYMPLP